MAANPDRHDAPSPDVTLEDLLRAFRRNIELGLRVSMPAEVVTYNPADQTAVVRLGLVPVVILDGEEVEDPPITLPPIPVGWLGSSAGYVTVPLTVGDTGWVIFSDRCTTRWLEKGEPVDPENGRTHALADAIFVPMGRHSKNAITPATDLTATVLHGEMIKLERTASQFVALADLVLQELQARKTWDDGHTHNLVGVMAGPGTIATTPPLTPSPTPGSVAATKVQAK